MTSETVRITTPSCWQCRKPTVMTVSASGAEAYRKGAYVQDAFPELSPDDRELLISGTHPECWDALYGEEE